MLVGITGLPAYQQNSIWVVHKTIILIELSLRRIITWTATLSALLICQGASFAAAAAIQLRQLAPESTAVRMFSSILSEQECGRLIESRGLATLDFDKSV